MDAIPHYFYVWSSITLLLVCKWTCKSTWLSRKIQRKMQLNFSEFRKFFEYVSEIKQFEFIIQLSTWSKTDCRVGVKTLFTFTFVKSAELRK